MTAFPWLGPALHGRLPGLNQRLGKVVPVAWKAADKA
jgi:hypothetical protein